MTRITCQDEISRQAVPRGLLTLLLLGSALVACAGAAGCRAAPDKAGAACRAAGCLEPGCPAEEPAPAELPFQRALHLLPERWLLGPGAPPKLQLSAERIAALNRAVASQRRESGLPSGRWELDALRGDGALFRARVRGRLDRLLEAFQRRERFLSGGVAAHRMLQATARETEQMQDADEIRVALRSGPLRCYPTHESIFDRPDQSHFDLARCAQLRLGEPVRVLLKSRRFWYVWSTYTDGWVEPELLGGSLDADQVRRYLRPARLVVPLRDRIPLWRDRARTELLDELRLGVPLPLVGEEGDSLRVLVAAPGDAGLGEAWLEARDRLSIGYPELTRSSLLRTAFDLLDAPYGWGGAGDHRDCSRLLMDLFATFGLRIPRNSWHQARAGLKGIDVSALDEVAKVAAIEKAAERSLVLLYLPGHIMLFIGRDGDHLYALHQFSGYLVPCPGGGETMMRVNRVAVTSLELGRGSSRRSFIERITQLVLLEGDGQGSAPQRASHEATSRPGAQGEDRAGLR